MGDILFYGERGLVNGIILDIKDDVGKQKSFLKAIRFADGSELNWIGDIAGMDFIVEPSFSEFGNPDLIIIAHETNKKRHVIFIEAKVCCYDDAAIKIPVSYKNNASKINIQLALKFRFAEVFTKANNLKSIEETAEDGAAYQDTPRRLKNRGIIKLCNNHFSDAVDFFFVALTNDLHTTEPYDNPEYYPPIGNWVNHCGRFGLVSYDMLEKANVVKRNGGYYGRAAKAFLGLPADIGDTVSAPVIKTINRSNWSAEQKETAVKLVNALNTATECPYAEQNGSYSFLVNGITILKVFTQKDNSIVLALRNDGLPEDYSDHLTFGMYRIGVGKNGRSFACAKFDAGSNQWDHLAAYAAGYIEKRMAAAGE